MKSRIYIGHVEHQRHHPVRHELSYPLYLYALDLDELTQLDREYPLFGYNRLRPTSIHDTDYLQTGPMGIKAKIKALADENGIAETIHRVVMITSARYFNYVFNPVNFHYCFSPEGDLACVVAEVNNTYGERHLYVLNEAQSPLNGFRARYRADKKFHVSPFNGIQGTYDFFFSDLSERLEVRIDLVIHGQKVFYAGLKARALPMTPFNHMMTLVRHPFVPHLSVIRIYREAFKLYFSRKLRFHDKPVPTSRMTILRNDPGWGERLCQGLIFSAFRKIKSGRLTLELPNGRIYSFGTAGAESSGHISVRDFRFFTRVALDGDIGLGESYVNGEWETPDLVNLFILLIANRDQFSNGNFVTSFLTRVKERVHHNRRKNTIANSRENIAGHYDLGNDFYQLFLDRGMVYSCAMFQNKNDALEIAQLNKMRVILEKARIGPHDHLLEIGCGWGGFAIFAARETGCRVTGVTVSRAQYGLACQRVEQAGLTGQITILLEDYRRITGRYDRIISIEMVEAVGKQFLGRFFSQCSHLLKPEGRMVLQAITIPDDRYDAYCRERDWIQKHIFPGGHLPCLSSIRRVVKENSDFAIEHVAQIGRHYATTLHLWRQRFESGQPALSRMGFDRWFQRKWIYYFSICEAGFKSNALQDIQMVLTRQPPPGPSGVI